MTSAELLFIGSCLLIGFLLVFVLTTVPASLNRGKKKAVPPKPAPAPAREEGPIYTGKLDHSGAVTDVYVSGLAHHCSRKDIGLIFGWVTQDKSNPVDPEAMALVSKSRKYGYIPAAILSSFRQWAGESDLRFVGYIYEEAGKLRGRARIYQFDALSAGEIFDDALLYAKAAFARFGWGLDEIPSHE